MRLVIKIGTQVIRGKSGLNQSRIRQIVAEIAQILKLGHEVILVSSGAIGAGLPLINFNAPLRKKIAAAIGQPLLMLHYINEAKKHKILVGQILILSDDFTNRTHFKNFVLNIEAMLSNKVLPIINENDVMKREDLRVNDNDMLGAMVSVGVRAHKLIILTNHDGLYTKDPDHHDDAELVKIVPKIDAKIKSMCSSGKSDLGVGGMLAKIKAADYATHKGVEVLIGNGGNKGSMLSALGRNFTGTRFIAQNKLKK